MLRQFFYDFQERIHKNAKYYFSDQTINVKYKPETKTILITVINKNISDLEQYFLENSEVEREIVINGDSIFVKFPKICM